MRLLLRNNTQNTQLRKDNAELKLRKYVIMYYL